MQQKVSVVVLGSLFCATACWGLVPVATRYLLGALNPTQILLLRFGIAGVFFLPIVFGSRRQRWSRQDIVRIVICSCSCVPGYNVTVTFGLRWLPASTSSLLVATSPIWIALFSALFDRERIRPPLVVGLFLALSGSLLLTGGNLLGTTSWHATTFLGAMLALLAAMMWACYTVAVRPLSHKYGSLYSTALTTLLGTLPLFLFWDTHLLPQLRAQPIVIWLAILFLALGSTILANSLWNYGTSRVASTQAGLFLYLVPIVSVSGGAFLLHEQISATIWISGLLVIAGVMVAQLRFLPGKDIKVQRANPDERPTHSRSHHSS